MSLPFARSLRSLESDGYRTGLICLLIVTPLFMLWLLWFFMGEVALYEVGGKVSLTSDGLVEASFAKGLPPLLPGIDAELHISDSEDNSSRIVQGYVHRFVEQDDGSTVAHIALENVGISVDEALTGVPMIEIDSVSPAQFLWEFVDND